MREYCKERQEYQEWLDSLKVGDKVVIERRCSSSTYSIAQIEKITPTRRITVGGYTFRSNGRVFNGGGYSYSSTYLKKFTPDILKVIEMQNIKRSVSNTFHSLYDKINGFTDEQYITFDKFFRENGFYDNWNKRIGFSC